MTEGTTFSFQRLDVYVAARELAAVVHLARISDAELRDQASRASKSVVLNLAEGLGSESAGVKRRHFAIAAGSVQEVAAAVDLAAAIGALQAPTAERARPSRSASGRWCVGSCGNRYRARASG